MSEWLNSKLSKKTKILQKQVHCFLTFQTPLVPLLSKLDILHSLGHSCFELLFRDLENIHHLLKQTMETLASGSESCTGSQAESLESSFFPSHPLYKEPTNSISKNTWASVVP